MLLSKWRVPATNFVLNMAILTTAKTFTKRQNDFEDMRLFFVVHSLSPLYQPWAIFWRPKRDSWGRKLCTNSTLFPSHLKLKLWKARKKAFEIGATENSKGPLFPDFREAWCLIIFFFFQPDAYTFVQWNRRWINMIALILYISATFSET